ncbi:MAG: DUF4269 domain-containing protein [Gorillibacterium sp.]|nr:DUF4269 domain-containing protein [Gorillibacterium sp.]
MTCWLSLNSGLFLDLAYLNQGNERQRDVYNILTEMNLFAWLKPFTPILVGTVPIDLDIPGSDLDIICNVENLSEWVEMLTAKLYMMSSFHSTLKKVNNRERAIVRFSYQGWDFELYGESVPTIEQNGYRHMIVEYRLIQLAGSSAGNLIREWKLGGVKTEPAFAKLLGLRGDPYQNLLDLSTLSDDQLLCLIQKGNVSRL